MFLKKHKVANVKLERGVIRRHRLATKGEVEGRLLKVRHS
jgi:hypothetical protein